MLEGSATGELCYTFVMSGAGYFYTRFFIQRGLAAIYLVGFLIAANQFRGLCGKNGLAPVRQFVPTVNFWDSPSLFWFVHSDLFFSVCAWIGVALSLLCLAGIADRFSTWVSAPIWAGLWLLYLSFVNVGQVFYGFGWEMLLLEAGFVAIFLGASSSMPPVLLIWVLRWLLFRVMFGAGLIKIRGDECWRDLTCLKFHWETQPLPGPLSWYFYYLPMWGQRLGVAINHVVELIVPFGYFGPAKVRMIAGVTTILFQAVLMLSGNLSWLNCLTIVIAFACLDDTFFLKFGAGALGLTTVTATAAVATGFPVTAIYALVAMLLLLSIQPTMNLLSNGQLMNASFNPFHLVNTYGAFGSVTRERDELVIEGTSDTVITTQTEWKAYGFRGKPGDLNRRPPQVTPYHYKLDWQMWFAAMNSYRYHPWIVNLVAKLLQGEPNVTGLLRDNPFSDHPPQFVRIRHFVYRFTEPGEAGWWRRDEREIYLPPLSLKNPEFQQIIEANGWDIRE